VLIVVGRQDTGELEAQIRGSRHAWDIRLISAEALLTGHAPGALSWRVAALRGGCSQLICRLTTV